MRTLLLILLLVPIMSFGQAPDIEWEVTIDGVNQSQHSYSVQQTNDEGYIICGDSGPLDDGDPEVYLIKTDSEGNVTSTIELPTINKSLITTIDILGRETTNKGFQLHIYDDGTVEKKYLIK